MYRALLQLLYYLLDLEVQRSGSGGILRPSYVGCKPQRRSKQLWRELSVLVTINTFLRYCSSKNSAIFSFFSVWVFFHKPSRMTGQQGKGEDISLAPHYHFYPLHRHLDISPTITGEGSPLHIGSSPTRTTNLWFPSASR